MAKSYKNIQEKRELTIEQKNAIEILVTGASDEAAAQAVGVSRQTVWEWRNRDDEFAAQLERKRQDIWRGHEDKIRALIPKAIAILEQALESDDERTRLAAAKHLLASSGIYGTHGIEPVGHTSAYEVALGKALTWGE